MKITVRFYGIAYDHTKTREWNPELTRDSTVCDLLKVIVKQFPRLSDLVYDGDEVRDYLSISVNNEDILGLEGMDTVLKHGDRVFIMPPIGGG